MGDESSLNFLFTPTGSLVYVSRKPHIMRRSNCSAPIPSPGQPRGHHFFYCCPGVLITLIFTCLALYILSNHSFSQCPAPFYHTNFSSDPGATPGEGMGAEQFDRRMM